MIQREAGSLWTHFYSSASEVYATCFFFPSFMSSSASTICSSIDFATGMAVNQDYSLWDYRQIPFNFMGQVCLQNSLVYTTAATLIVWVFYPLLETAVEEVGQAIVESQSLTVEVEPEKAYSAQLVLDAVAECLEKAEK